MNKPRFYISTNTAGLSAEEVKNKIDSIVKSLKIIGVNDSQIFRTDSIDTTSMPFDQEINIRMLEVAKADVLILDYGWDEWIQGKIELKEAERLGKHIRTTRPGDFEDIRINFMREFF